MLWILIAQCTLMTGFTFDFFIDKRKCNRAIMLTGTIHGVNAIVSRGKLSLWTNDLIIIRRYASYSRITLLMLSLNNSEEVTSSWLKVCQSYNEIQALGKVSVIHLKVQNGVNSFAVPILRTAST